LETSMPTHVTTIVSAILTSARKDIFRFARSSRIRSRRPHNCSGFPFLGRGDPSSITVSTDPDHIGLPRPYYSSY
jgi:hypothetical protein